MFAGGFLTNETSGSVEVPEEAMEVLAPVLETMVVESDMGSSTPVLEVVAAER